MPEVDEAMPVRFFPFGDEGAALACRETQVQGTASVLVGAHAEVLGVFFKDEAGALMWWRAAGADLGIAVSGTSTQ